MKFFITVFAIIASFSVNANETYGEYDDSPTKPFDASQTSYTTMKISWIRVAKNQVLAECNIIRKRYGLDATSVLLDGCTVWHNDECMVVTENVTTMHTLGHETRHCFQRNWH